MEPTPEASDLLGALIGDVRTGSALAGVLDALPDAIVVVDMQGSIVYASEPAARLTGYPADELVSMAVEQLVPESTRMHHVQHRVAFARQPRGRAMGGAMDIELRRADAVTVPVDISLAPIDVAGERFVLAAIRDATERRAAARRTEAALERERDATAELRELSRLRDSFLRALSHDLRSPLASMLGLVMTVEARRDQLTDEQMSDLLERVRHSGERLDRVLTDLLEVDRASRPGHATEREDVDVRSLIRAVVDDLGAEAVAGVVIEGEGTPLLWPVDRAAVASAMENLVLNASKYARTDAPVSVRFAIEHDELVILVEDRGPGVPHDERDRIFEGFVRGSGAEGTSGTGVGLSLVAAFARAHGGRAWVEDRPGGGASFRFSLRRAGTA